MGAPRTVCFCFVGIGQSGALDTGAVRMSKTKWLRKPTRTVGVLYQFRIVKVDEASSQRNVSSGSHHRTHNKYATF